jgi:hypothetical protein
MNPELFFLKSWIVLTFGNVVGGEISNFLIKQDMGNSPTIANSKVGALLQLLLRGWVTKFVIGAMGLQSSIL